MDIKQYDFSNLEKAELERPEPELTFDRFTHIGPEGLRRFGRAEATAFRSHAENLQGIEQDLYEKQKPSPEQIQTIMDRFPGSFRTNPDMAAEVQRRVDQGQDSATAQWNVVQEHYLNKQAKMVDRLKKIEDAEIFESPREFRGKSSGIIEDVGMALFSSAPSTLATMASPVLGLPLIYGHMQGALQEELEQTAEQYGIDVDPNRIFEASTKSAMINTPLELVGNLFKIRGMMGTGKFSARVARLAEAFGGEALTEFAQKWPEEVALRWALNPDLDHITLTDHIRDTVTDPEAWKGATYEGFVGGLSGLVMGGAGQSFIGGIDRLIHPDQKAINESRLERTKEIISKPVDQMELSDKVDLLQMVGLDPVAVAEQGDQAVDDIVARVKGRLLFQAAPIESDEKNQLMDTIGSRLTPEQANHVLSMWDGMARVAAQEGLIEKPEDFYKQWISEVKQSQAAQVAGPDQGVLNQAPAEHQAYDAAKKFNEAHPDHDLKFDGEMDLSAINRPNMYQFTPQSGEYAGMTFVVPNTDAETIKSKFDEMISLRQKNKGTLQQDKRGAVEYLFDETPKIIHLFETADTSTLIHETGHVLNEMLYRAGSIDYIEAAKWVGVDDTRAAQGTKAWTTEELEKFAKGFELYMIEGRAPTMRLHAVFQRIKTFLLEIYNKISNQYFDGVNLTDDIRSLFDRWTATEHERANDPFYEVGEWYAVEDLAASDIELIKRAEADPGVWAEINYDQLMAEARRRVVERKAEQKKKLYKKLKAAFKKEAEDIVSADPFYEMLDTINKGGGLSLSQLKDLYDRDFVNTILAKRPGLFRASGAPADVTAHEFGYDMTHDLVEDLFNKPGKKQAVDIVIDNLWAEYEASEHLEQTSDYAESIDIEIDIINEMLGKKKPTKKYDLKKIIREQTGQKARSLPDAKQLRADLKRDEQIARKAWAEAVKATREIEKSKADEKKRTQLERVRNQKLNQILKLREAHREKVRALKEGFAANKKREKIWRRVNRKIRSKAMLPEYKSQITNFLSRYIRIPDSLRGDLPSMSLEQFVRAKLEDGENLDLLIGLLDVAPASVGPGEQLTIGDVETIGDIVDAISHIELNDRKQRLINEKETTAQAVDAMVDSITKTLPAPNMTDGPVGVKDLSFLQRMGERSREVFATLRKPEFIIRMLDGYETFGPNYKNIIEPIKKAEDAELIVGEESFNKLRDIWKEFDRAWAIKRYKVKGVAGTITKDKMIMVALNSGNEGNRAALVHGNGFHIETIEDILEQLTQEERQLVVKTWELIDSFYENRNKVHKQLTGVRLKKVDGRYFPMMFDAKNSYKAGEHLNNKQLRNLFAQTKYGRAKVQAGARIERKGGKLPLRLDTGVIFDAIMEAVHDITHQIPIRNVQKLIHNEKFRNVVSAWAGPEVYAQFQPWLSHVADPYAVEQDKYFDRPANWLRKNITVAYLGFKVMTGSQQILGYTQTIDAIGFSATARGVWAFLKNPTKIIEIKRMVDELSPSMQYRGYNWDRELSNMYKKFDPKKFGMGDEFKDAAFAFLQFVDAVNVYPTWLGAYYKAMDGSVKGINAEDHGQAIEYADMVIRTTQPTGMPKDTADIQRGGGTKKLFTMFQSFFNVFHNRLVEINQSRKLGKINAGQAMASYAYIVIAPAMLGFIMQERRLPKWDEIIREIFRYGLGGIPVLRDVVSAVGSDWGYTMSPAQDVGKRLASTTSRVIDLFQGDDVNAMGLTKDILYSGGYVVGLPSSAMVIAIDGAFDMAEGKTKNPMRLILREKKK